MLNRRTNENALSVTDSVLTTPEIDTEDVGGIRIHNHSVSSITLTVYDVTSWGVSACEDVEPVVIAAESSRALPLEMFASHTIRLVGSRDEADMSYTTKE